jgi:hypothetical protein
MLAQASQDGMPMDPTSVQWCRCPAGFWSEYVQVNIDNAVVNLVNNKPRYAKGVFSGDLYTRNYPNGGPDPNGELFEFNWAHPQIASGAWEAACKLCDEASLVKALEKCPVAEFSDDACAAGYTGKGCAVCVPNKNHGKGKTGNNPRKYIQNKISEQCEICPAVGFWYYAIFAIIMVVAGVVALKMIGVLQDKYFTGRMPTAQEMKRFKSFNVFTTTSQQVALVAANVEFPPQLTQLLNKIKFMLIDVDVASPECAISMTFTEKNTGILFGVPVVLITIFVVIILLNTLITWVRESLRSMGKRHRVRDRVRRTFHKYCRRCTYAFFGIMWYTETTMVMVALQPFDCTKSKMIDVVQFSDTVSCNFNDSQYRTYFPIACVGLFIYLFVVPLWMLDSLSKDNTGEPLLMQIASKLPGGSRTKWDKAAANAGNGGGRALRMVWKEKPALLDEDHQAESPSKTRQAYWQWYQPRLEMSMFEHIAKKSLHKSRKGKEVAGQLVEDTVCDMAKNSLYAQGKLPKFVLNCSTRTPQCLVEENPTATGSLFLARTAVRQHPVTFIEVLGFHENPDKAITSHQAGIKAKAGALNDAYAPSYHTIERESSVLADDGAIVNTRRKLVMVLHRTHHDKLVQCVPNIGRCNTHPITDIEILQSTSTAAAGGPAPHADDTFPSPGFVVLPGNLLDDQFKHTDGKTYAERNQHGGLFVRLSVKYGSRDNTRRFTDMFIEDWAQRRKAVEWNPLAYLKQRRNNPLLTDDQITADDVETELIDLESNWNRNQSWATDSGSHFRLKLCRPYHPENERGESLYGGLTLFYKDHLWYWPIFDQAVKWGFAGVAMFNSTFENQAQGNLLKNFVQYSKMGLTTLIAAGSAFKEAETTTVPLRDIEAVRQQQLETPTIISGCKTLRKMKQAAVTPLNSNSGGIPMSAVIPVAGSRKESSDFSDSSDYMLNKDPDFRGAGEDPLAAVSKTDTHHGGKMVVPYTRQIVRSRFDDTALNRMPDEGMCTGRLAERALLAAGFRTSCHDPPVTEVALFTRAQGVPPLCKASGWHIVGAGPNPDLDYPQWEEDVKAAVGSPPTGQTTGQAAWAKLSAQALPADWSLNENSGGPWDPDSLDLGQRDPDQPQPNDTFVAYKLGAHCDPAVVHLQLIENPGSYWKLRPFGASLTRVFKRYSTHQLPLDRAQWEKYEILPPIEIPEGQRHLFVRSFQEVVAPTGDGFIQVVVVPDPGAAASTTSPDHTQVAWVKVSDSALLGRALCPGFTMYASVAFINRPQGVYPVYERVEAVAQTALRTIRRLCSKFQRLKVLIPLLPDDANMPPPGYEYVCFPRPEYKLDPSTGAAVPSKPARLNRGEPHKEAANFTQTHTGLSTGRELYLLCRKQKHLAKVHAVSQDEPGGMDTAAPPPGYVRASRALCARGSPSTAKFAYQWAAGFIDEKAIGHIQASSAKDPLAQAFNAAAAGVSAGRVAHTLWSRNPNVAGHANSAALLSRICEGAKIGAEHAASHPGCDKLAAAAAGMHAAALVARSPGPPLESTAKPAAMAAMEAVISGAPPPSGFPTPLPADFPLALSDKQQTGVLGEKQSPGFMGKLSIMINHPGFIPWLGGPAFAGPLDRANGVLCVYRKAPAITDGSGRTQLEHVVVQPGRAKKMDVYGISDVRISDARTIGASNYSREVDGCGEYRGGVRLFSWLRVGRDWKREGSGLRFKISQAIRNLSSEATMVISHVEVTPDGHFDYRRVPVFLKSKLQQTLDNKLKKPHRDLQDYSELLMSYMAFMAWFYTKTRADMDAVAAAGGPSRGARFIERVVELVGLVLLSVFLIWVGRELGINKAALKKAARGTVGRVINRRVTKGWLIHKDRLGSLKRQNDAETNARRLRKLAGLPAKAVARPGQGTQPAEL